MLDIKEAVYERVILVGLITPKQREEELDEYLNELAFLSDTAGGKVIKIFKQRLAQPNPKMFVGTGKIEEMIIYVEENDIDTVIFDDELTPSQLKNLEKTFKRKIIDRTNLILDIFAQRAKTSYARTQVELAQNEYYLPRLTNLWTHLERQKGGIGMRGPGETEIETDRRIIRDRMTLLKKKLEKIDKQMSTQRKNRGALIRVALVGYTNVGKSTLLNVLSKSEVFAENKLFATLDTTVRKVVFGNLPFLMSDTVGFIRKLPTQLVASFKSTLDEVREADLLIHVLDVSHKNFEAHFKSVQDILVDLESNTTPTVIVLNKIDDFFSKEENADLNSELEGIRKNIQISNACDVVCISAVKGTGIDELKRTLYNNVYIQHKKRYPYNNMLFQYYDDSGGVSPNTLNK